MAFINNGQLLRKAKFSLREAVLKNKSIPKVKKYSQDSLKKNSYGPI